MVTGQRHKQGGNGVTRRAVNQREHGTHKNGACGADQRQPSQPINKDRSSAQAQVLKLYSPTNNTSKMLASETSVLAEVSDHECNLRFYFIV